MLCTGLAAAAGASGWLHAAAPRGHVLRRRCPRRFARAAGCLGRGSSAADVCSSSRPASRERRRGGRAAARQRACFPSHVRGARGRHAVGDCAGRLWRRQPLHRRACCKPRRVGQSIMHHALHAHVSRLAQVLRRRSAKTAAAFRLASCCGSLRSDVSRISFAQAFTCAKPLRQAQRRSQWGDARARLLGRKASIIARTRARDQPASPTRALRSRVPAAQPRLSCQRLVKRRYAYRLCSHRSAAHVRQCAAPVLRRGAALPRPGDRRSVAETRVAPRCACMRYAFRCCPHAAPRLSSEPCGVRCGAKGALPT